jgi:acetyl-CoA carboxylase carboxyl transferase subunit alpha
MAITHRLPFERPIYDLEEKLLALENQWRAEVPTLEVREEIRNMRMEVSRLKRDIFDNLDAWETVQVARHAERPQTDDYLELIFDEFVELHGDKSFGDDRAIRTGFAKIEDRKVMFVGQQKGKTLKERAECFYGCPHPEGYRKALAKMQMAAKFKLPVICFIDTPGAHPGIGAEERGQAYNIALNLREMSRIPTPIICVVIGEGGSGGALGIGIGDHIAMLQHTYYSVISPEGCAGILWKHSKYANLAAKALKFTSKDLHRLGVIDEVIQEPLGAAHRDHRAMAATLKSFLVRGFRSLSGLKSNELLDRRYNKFRKMGVFEEQAATEVIAKPA